MTAAAVRAEICAFYQNTTPKTTKRFLGDEPANYALREDVGIHGREGTSDDIISKTNIRLHAKLL